MVRKRAKKRKRKVNRDTGPKKGKNEDATTPVDDVLQEPATKHPPVDDVLEEPATKTQKLSPQELHDEPSSHHLMTGPNETLSPSKQVRFTDFLSRARPSPLPEFSWGDSKDVWEAMLQKDERHIRNPDLFNQHPALTPRMRAKILDWLMEVCHCYNLSREIYYLSVDLLDRYLGQSHNISVNQLETIGITALFTAAKLEGPYVPMVAELLALHTDRNITEEDIFKQERLMIQALDWDMCPITSIGWLKLYLEVITNKTSLPASQHDFMFPKHSFFAFAKIARLMDLAIMDAGCLKFKHSVLAAAAVYHLVSKEVALFVSGLKLADILPCVTWMTPFAETILEMEPETMKVLPGVDTRERHDIQPFSVSSSVLEKVQGRQHAV